MTATETIDAAEMTTPDAEGDAEATCEVCGETGVGVERNIHGECLLRETFGAIAELLVPEDVAAGEVDRDGGMTPRQSGFAVEVCIDRTSANAVLHRGTLGEMPLEDRRTLLLLLVVRVSGDAGALNALEEAAPDVARQLRMDEAMRTLMKLAIEDDADDEEDDEDTLPAHDQEDRAR